MHACPQRLILVVEDNDEARRWIVEALAHHFTDATVIEAADCRAAGAVLDSLSAEPGRVIDFAFIDIGLPDGSGIDIIRKLSLDHPATTPIVITIFDDDATVFDALAAGALGYVLKSVTTTGLVEQLKRIEQGEPPISPAIAARLLAYFRKLPAFVEPQDQAGRSPDGLTPRELEILSLIGKGLTVSDISSVLGISRNTGNTHVKSIYRKLDISTRAEAALEANRRGLI